MSIDELTDEDERQSRGTGSLLNDKNRSGLLVVLDDDEMPASERFEKGTASITRGVPINVAAATITPKGRMDLEPEEDDDDNDRGEVKLPDLPRI